MRTNIVLEDALVAQALTLTGASSKKEVVNLALSRLVASYKDKNIDKQQFIAAYMDNPIISDDFIPLERDEVYAR